MGSTAVPVISVLFDLFLPPPVHILLTTTVCRRQHLCGTLRAHCPGRARPLWMGPAVKRLVRPITQPHVLLCSQSHSWIRADTDKARMRNFILDLYLWQILSCIIATVSVAATLIKLFRQGRATSRALFDGNSINLEMSAESHEINLKPKQRSFLARILRRRRQSHDRENMFGHLEDKFVGIALRISLYPITLIIVNGLITIGDLYFSASGGVKNQATYGLYCVYYFLYGGRGIFFAALGLFVDPCIGRGLKAIWKTKYSKEAREAHREMEPKVALGSDELPVIHTPLSSRVDPLNIAHEAGPNGSLVERAQRTLNGGELGTNNSMGLTQLERQNSAASLDMLTALFMSDPDDYHDHWTQEFHAESGDAGLRKKRASRRAHSLPTPRFHIPRLFGRRKSEMVTAGSGDCDPSPKPTPDDSQAAGPTPVPSDGPPTPIHEMPTPPGFSMTFAGVPTDALPDIMDDHAHDVVLPEALEAAQAAAASHSATPTPRLGSIRSGLQSGLTSGQRTPMGGTPPVRRGSLAESSGVLGRRGSMIEAYSARRGSVAAPPGSLRSSINNGRPGPRRGATLPPGLHLRDSLESPRSPRDDRRVRRERALEIAEKLYEEMEAQL